MNAGLKVGGFVAGLVVVGAIGAGIGAVAGPVDTEPAAHDEPAHEEPTPGAPGHGADDHDEPAADEAPAGDGHGDHDGAPAEDEAQAGDEHGDHEEAPAGEATAAGTSATQDGYRLALAPTGDELRFQVLDPDGAPVVETEIVHEQPLHLIVVGRDLVGYAHVHPEVDADGTWSVARPDLAPGSYRVVADLMPVDGPELVLGGDLTVPGAVAPVAVPEPATTATVDGLTVAMEGHAEVGDVELSFALDGGEPEPYLGARGHLVAFRTDDLAYSHVHPLLPGATRELAGGDSEDGPVTFTASFPTEGTYRLFLDLQVDGVVRTFPFTVEVHGHDH